MQEEISLKEVFDIIKKYIGRIIGVAIVFAVIAALVTAFFIDPKYRSTTQLLVNQESTTTNEINYNQIQTSVQLINTYSEIIVSEPIVQEALDRMGDTTRTAEEAQGMIDVTNTTDSQIFAINVTSKDPKYSADLANTLAATFSENIGDIFDVDNVSIITPAQVNPDPVSPNLVLNTLIAFVIGAGLAMLMAFIREAMDTTVKDEEDIEKMGLLLIGQITALSEKDLNETRYRRGSVRAATPSRSRLKDSEASEVKDPSPADHQDVSRVQSRDESSANKTEDSLPLRRIPSSRRVR